MPSIYDIKPQFQALLRPMTQSLARCGVTPNQVTWFALILSVAVGGCVALYPAERWSLLLVPPFLFARMALNAIDGMLAREHGMTSHLGMILNEVGDVLSDAALYLPFALIPGISPFLVVPLTVLAIISEMTGIVAAQICGQRRYDGPLGKSDRAFLFGSLALLLGLGIPPGRWLDVLLGIAVALVGLTVINRARRALRTAPRNTTSEATSTPVNEPA